MKRYDTKKLIMSDRTATVLNHQVRQGLITGEGNIEIIPLANIVTSSHNPRSLPINDDVLDAIQKGDNDDFNDVVTDLISLADSIKTNGLLQPIVVKQLSDGKYEIVAGERRYWAVKLLKKEVIRAIVRQVETNQHISIALTENLARTDLSLLEKVDALKSLIEVDNKYAMANEVQQMIGVSNRAAYQLLKAVFDQDIYQAIVSGKIKSMREIDSFSSEKIVLEKPKPLFIRWKVSDNQKNELLELAKQYKPDLYDQLTKK